MDAAMAMSGGLQPGPKYEQVVADDCWPMKLALALVPPSPDWLAGVATFAEPAAETALVLSLERPCRVVDDRVLAELVHARQLAAVGAGRPRR